MQNKPGSLKTLDRYKILLGTNITCGKILIFIYVTMIFGFDFWSIAHLKKTNAFNFDQVFVI
jgi:hypothetical protein